MIASAGVCDVPLLEVERMCRRLLLSSCNLYTCNHNVPISVSMIRAQRVNRWTWVDSLFHSSSRWQSECEGVDRVIVHTNGGTCRAAVDATTITTNRSDHALVEIKHAVHQFTPHVATMLPFGVLILADLLYAINRSTLKLKV